jgi:superfamily II DNA or RNA helicase
MTDQTFITNENGQTLQARFASLIKDTRFFDVLSGYFYSSGFKAIYPSLENTEKIRILVGISTDYKTYAAVKSAKELASSEVGKIYASSVKKELEEAEDSIDTEESVYKFKEWLESGRIEIKAYLDEKIHSKVYIMTFDSDDRDKGRVITGSSNFTESGLRGNIEFNVELKNRSDYDYALERFNELWDKGVDVSEQYVETINQETWLNDKVTPYELYLKFLYEYFREEINQDEDRSHQDSPDGFMKLQYQEDAVFNAKRILNEYNGVFISDVVGLGKTYIGTMLCQELPGKTLVIAPPHLIDKNNPGSWENAFREFNFSLKDCRFESSGIIDQIAEKGLFQEYNNIVIDEAHTYRNDGSNTFKHLMRICKDKKVILVTATPYNNNAKDLLSQIKLFQLVRNSSIPNLRNIEKFFNVLDLKLKKINKNDQPIEHIKQVKKNAREIRERLLKYIMVRRTRQEIQKFYSNDIDEQGIKFPVISDPKAIFYEFDDLESKVFDETLRIFTEEFSFTRYRPLEFLKDTSKLKNIEKQSGRGLVGVMKTLIVKRLESSTFAFKKSVSRFIETYDSFIAQYKSGTILISKRHNHKIKELLAKDDAEAINEILSKGEAEKYNSSDFKETFYDSLLADRDHLFHIRDSWKKITTDSKLSQFKSILKTNENLINNKKKIIFTESAETCAYLKDKLDTIYKGRVLNFSGGSSSKDRESVINNFDNDATIKQDDFDVLITTDVLAEGVNLHQCNVVINYDLPWNPTKIMQRVGRINRINTPHNTIYTFNFFPTEKSNNEIGQTQNAVTKIGAFFALLGSDSKLLTDDEEVEAHSLFEKLNAKETIVGDEDVSESPLGYLQEIRTVRDENEELFMRIKTLPKKSRAARVSSRKGLLTFLRRGRFLKKFYFTSQEKKSKEKDFIEAALMLKAKPDDSKGVFNKSYYDLLTLNKASLATSLAEEDEEINKAPGGASNINTLKKLLSSTQISHFKKYTEDQEGYLRRVIKEIGNGGIAKAKAKEALEKINHLELIQDPIKLINRLKNIITDSDLTKEKVQTDETKEKKEVILSEFYN